MVTERNASFLYYVVIAKKAKKQKKNKNNNFSFEKSTEKYHENTPE